MSRNIELNLNREKKSRSVKHKVLNLDWESDEETGFAPDIVLGADIVFDPSLVPSLVSTISKLLCEKNGTAFICSTVRKQIHPIKDYLKENSIYFFCPKGTLAKMCVNGFC